MSFLVFQQTLPTTFSQLRGAAASYLPMEEGGGGGGGGGDDGHGKHERELLQVRKRFN